MNRFLSALVVLILCLPVVTCAQNAREVMIRFNKSDRHGWIAEYPYPVKVVENALKERLNFLGKSRTKKGFVSYQGVDWTELSPKKIDVYYKVDGKRNQSNIYLLISKGYNNFVGAGPDSALAEKIMSFLNGLGPDIQEAERRMNITRQEEVVRQSEEKRNSSQGELDRLTSRRERIEKRISEQQEKHDRNEKNWIEDKELLERMKAK